MQQRFTTRQWLLAGALLLAAILSVTPFLDQKAVANYESLFQRALVTFALARTLNGVISAVQGTEVALQPAGVGVTLTPGQILDPVNDLVERFSWIMLGATLSLGVQDVLLDISAYWLVQAVVVVLALWMLVLVLSRRESAQAQRRILWRVLMVALFLRFAVPLTLIANEAVYDLFLESRYDESSAVITSAGDALQELGAEQSDYAQSAPREGVIASLMGPISDAWDSATEGMSISDKVDAIQDRAAEMIENLIQLSVVFVLQTGVLPVAFLWLFLQLGKWLFRPAGNDARAP